MASLLSSGLPISKRIYEGKYTFMKREVIVEVNWHSFFYFYYILKFYN